MMGLTVVDLHHLHGADDVEILADGFGVPAGSLDAGDEVAEARDDAQRHGGHRRRQIGEVGIGGAAAAAVALLVLEGCP